MIRSGNQTVIVGAGITGLTIARELVARGEKDILILEKEDDLGLHASGRNSGVLHAGIYYTPDTLKARFCIEGNRLMKQFCREKGLTIRGSGKVIVAKTSDEIPLIHELHSRAAAAGATSEVITEGDLASHEPNATTCEVALWSPETAVIRPSEILAALKKELLSHGVEIRTGSRFMSKARGKQIVTSTGVIGYDRLVNAAGSFADRIAHAFGMASEYKILPFKGTYKKLRPERADLIRGNVYPVPDLEKPFLGVHFTRSVDDDVYVGPTAIPAFGRENYRGWRGLGAETFTIAYRDGLLLFRDRSFRASAIAEVRKYSKRYVYREARMLVPSLRTDDLLKATKVGIRPQLIHWPTKRLVMDFVIMGQDDTLHVLNAISPAFTSSMAFARHAVSALNDRSTTDAI